MKREITFCSAPFFRVFQDVFQKGGKSSAGDGFLSFLFRKRKKDGTNAYEARWTRKERRKDGNENRKNREADGRKRRKKRKRGDASPALLFTSSKPEEGEHASSTKREERKPSFLSFSFLPLLAQFCSPYQLLCQLADDRSDHAVANPLIYAQHMDRTDQKKKAIPLLIEIRGFLA